jgi:hypothetical protein
MPGANRAAERQLGNGQPAFGCYLPDAHSAIARPYGPMVLTLGGDRIFAITWFGDSSLFPTSGSPNAARRTGLKAICATPGLLLLMGERPATVTQMRGIGRAARVRRRGVLVSAATDPPLAVES